MGRPIGRILMTADAMGGVWTYALELARALEPRGIAVTLATMGREPDPDQRREAAAVPNLALEVSSFRLEWMQEPWRDVDAAGRWLLDLAEGLRPHLVHLNGYAHGALPWKRPVVIVGHSCVLSWWEAVEGEDAPAAWAPYRKRIRDGLRGAGRVLAPTGAMLEELERHYGPLPASGVIPNGLADGPVAGDPIEGKEEAILSVGRLWDRAKNVEALARVAPGIPWPVRVAGEERHPEEGRPFEPGALEPLGVLSRSALAREMRRAAIFALPARYEPFGLAALEAARHGCALVLGDIPSLREVWGDAARYVPPSDTRALAALLDRLVHDAEERVELGSAARERAERYGRDAMGEAYARCYAELLESGP